MSRPARFWSRLRRAFFLYLLIPYVAVIVIFAVVQRRLMYQPAVATSLRIADVGLDDSAGMDVELKTPDGATLRGWLVAGSARRKDATADDPLVLYFAGNSLNRQQRISDLREIASQGFDVLIFDYRGFGDSTGSPTEAKLSADAIRIWNYARKDLGYDESRIVVFGESLGGAVALSLWSPDNPASPQPAALILNSTFTSMPQTVAWHYPLFPFQYLLLDRWPSIERIQHVAAPVIVFHGDADPIVPIEHGRLLAGAAADGRFVEVPGGAHNEISLLQLGQELDSLRTAILNRQNLRFPGR